MLLNNKYKDIIKKNITEIAVNRDANSNTLWETIKGTIRNETIKFATHTRKQTRKQEEIIESEILKLQKDILETTDNDKIESIKKTYWKKIMHLKKITEGRIQGLILRSKAETVGHGEKNSKYFASLEKKRSEQKSSQDLKLIKKNNTNQTEILSETELF